MSEGKLLKFFFGGPDPREWRVYEFVNMMVATQKRVVNPLQIRYWSQTPFALGPHVVKYSAQPNGRRTGRKPISDGSNYLEDAMARQLASGEASFDFTVQLQTDPREMPVEDPTIRWKERASPFRKVATIRIPPQEFASRRGRTSQKACRSRRGTRCPTTGPWAASTGCAGPSTKRSRSSATR